MLTMFALHVYVSIQLTLENRKAKAGVYLDFRVSFIAKLNREFMKALSGISEKRDK